MVVPVTDQASQKIRTAQKCAVGRSWAPDYDVVAPASAGVLPVQHEFLRAQMGLAGKRVNRLGGSHKLVPGFRWMDVYFDHAWIRRHFEHLDSRIERQGVAFQH